MKYGKLVALILLLVSSIGLTQADTPVAIIDYKDDGGDWKTAQSSLKITGCDSVALKSHYGGNSQWSINGKYFSDKTEILFRPEEYYNEVVLTVTNNDGSHEDKVAIRRNANAVPKLTKISVTTGTDENKETYSGDSNIRINTGINQQIVIKREYNNDDELSPSLSISPASGAKILAEESGEEEASVTIVFETKGDYTLNFKDKDLCGNYDPVKVGVNAYSNTPPVPVITGETIGDENGIDLSGEDSHDPDPGDRVIKWVWKEVGEDGTESTQTGEEATFEIPPGSVSDVTLTVTDSNGGSASTTETIASEWTENVKPVADLSKTPDTATKGVEFTLDASRSTDDSEIIEYIWDIWYLDPTGTDIHVEGFPLTTDQPTEKATLSRAGDHRIDLAVKDDAKPTGGFSKEDTDSIEIEVVLEGTATPTPTPTPSQTQPPENRTSEQIQLEDSIENALITYEDTSQRKIPPMVGQVAELMESIIHTPLTLSEGLEKLAMWFFSLGIYIGIILVILLMLMLAFQLSLPGGILSRISEALTLWRTVGIFLLLFGEGLVVTVSLLSTMVAGHTVCNLPYSQGEIIAIAITSAVVGMVNLPFVMFITGIFINAVGVYAIILMIFAALARGIGVLLIAWPNNTLLIRVTKVFILNTQYPLFVALLIFATSVATHWLPFAGVSTGTLVPGLILLAGSGYLTILLIVFITRPGESYIRTPIDLTKKGAYVAGTIGLLYLSGGTSAVHKEVGHGFKFVLADNVNDTINKAKTKAKNFAGNRKVREH